ncbi:aspartate 1-decarboxylase [candidate division WOR-3 bacterium]|nr:aspartate 1-decarboxylase [candidate division WOR-3 bacterium]
MKHHKYCPVCQSYLVKKDHDGMIRLVCEHCGWVHYMNPLPSVAALVFSDDRSHVLLVKRGELPKKGSWALPTGFLEQNETCEEAVIRELHEETGLRATVKELINVHCERTKEYGSVVLIGFEMTIVSGKPHPGSDSIAVDYFPLKKLPTIPFASHRRMIADALRSKTQRFIEVLKSKITDARITGTQLFYKGSMGIDRSIMDAVGIVEGEKVHVLNYSNGERLETYTIAERAGSGKFILYGPASRKGNVGDRLCILSYQLVDHKEAPGFTPQIAVLDERNRLKRKHT